MNILEPHCKNLLYLFIEEINPNKLIIQLLKGNEKLILS